MRDVSICQADEVSDTGLKIRIMPKTKKTGEKRPTNKANMEQPQEEFIAPESAHFEQDRGHGHEVKPPDRARDGEEGEA